MRFPGSDRLRSAREFREVLDKGHKQNCGPFLSFLLHREVEGVRLGVIASKKVGNAVKRNRAKRLFRELFRKNRGELPPCSDLVIVIRSSFENYSYDELEERFLKACKRYRDEE